ncbi:MAG TPA: Ig-like domain-containing protein [Gemmatimonadales bacterium]|nr:Ig-like domain-containing protein [Gemmatimonadales bacterium]
MRWPAAIALSLVLTSCAQHELAGPTTLGTSAKLSLRADLSGTSVARVVVQVTAADISVPLVFNIPVANGVAAGTFTVPTGSARTIALTAYDAGGVETDSGSVQTEVLPGANPAIVIVLVPLAGNVSITAILGSFTVTISPSSLLLNLGDTAHVTALVQDDSGHAVSGTVVWASLSPAVAKVVSTGDQTGKVTAVGSGQAILVASFGGIGGVAGIVVTGTTPTLVQHVATPNTHFTGGTGSAQFIVPLPNRTLANNAILVGFQDVDGGSVVSVTDDRGNAYTAGPSVGGQGFLYYALGTTAGVSRITVTFANIATRFAAVVGEFSNVATANAADGSGSGSGDATTVWAAAPFSTITDGDLIYSVGFDFSYPNGSGDQPNFVAPAVPGPNFTFAAADLEEGMFAQYQVQPIHGSVVPVMEVSTPRDYGTVALALKPARTGTLPGPGIRIVRVQHAHFAAGMTGGNMQFPSSGNLIVVGYSQGDNSALGALVDTRGNRYIELPGSPLSTADGGSVQLLYAPAATTANDLLVNATLTAPCDGSDFVFYDVAGAAPSPLDTVATAVGAYDLPAPQFVSVTLVPRGAGELVIAHGDQNTGTVTGLVGAGYLFDMPTWGGQDEGGAGGGAVNEFTLDSQGGHYYTTDANPVTFTWLITNGTAAGSNAWETIAAAFRGQ